MIFQTKLNVFKIARNAPETIKSIKSRCNYVTRNTTYFLKLINFDISKEKSQFSKYISIALILNPIHCP